uniref:Inner nuclear membrane protein Man1 n=1 Tax=Aceria tosichella TaxID=561515 RepID=A0A6G1S475_9ACAR
MSQRRHKKDLSIMDNVVSLTDHELRAALKDFDVSPGPITDSTRNLYRKKLATLMEESDKGGATSPRAQTMNSIETAVHEDDEDDTSDEDYEVHEEEELDDEEEDDEDEDLEEEEEDLMSELQDDDISSSRINTSTALGDLTNRTDSDASANRISRAILISIVSFFVLIFGFYLVSSNNLALMEPLKPFKDITKRILILLALSPIGYAAYRSLRFYRLRRHEENQKVCELVSEALELLQSPDNPKGLMPILHIRDTLLTPAERKTKKTNMLWQKAVKFIEEHESRVKVELVNIDGEDFRAWKWIGSRKL